ncbi:MAG: hypothetical protein LQ343_004823 [Gyalolechia ehrenbergii]|nr:MAG: hypothetical protein LQ343_004823 [Gyalolechia ehrenbergii]
MPKAAKSTTSKASSRVNPLGATSPNAAKKHRSKASDNSKESSKLSSKGPQSVSAPADDVTASGKTQSSDNLVRTAKADDSESNYLVLVSNTLTFDPTITRLLSLPPSLTFGKFHQALQVAFGWANCHMHQFTVEVSSPRNDHGHNNAGGRKHSLPKRVLTLQSGTSMDEEDDEDDTEDENRWTLRDVLERKEWNGQTVASAADMHLIYEYDMGDGWEHQINILGRADKGLHSALTGFPPEKAQQVLCIAGEGHPCAEDCGSEPGWEDLKNAFKKPRGDKEQKDWYKNMCANGDKKGLDPWKWDMLDVNERLENIKA